MEDFEQKYWDAQRKIDEYERERAENKQAIVDISEQNIELKRMVADMTNEKEKYRKLYSQLHSCLIDISNKSSEILEQSRYEELRYRN